VRNWGWFEWSYFFLVIAAIATVVAWCVVEFIVL
jgi:hypothetical protein